VGSASGFLQQFGSERFMNENSENMIILDEFDPAAQTALRTGWLHGKRLLAREVLVSEPEGVQVIFEEIPKTQTKPQGLAPWLQAIRAFSLTATVTPCVAVLLYAHVTSSALRLGSAFAALLGVCFLQIAVNVFNDIEDYRKLIDLPNTTGGSGVIQSGFWTPLELSKIAWGAFALGSALGGYALFFEFQHLWVIALLAGIGVLGYSAKSFGFKYKALGDLIVLALCGPILTLGYSIAATGGFWDKQVIFIGLYFGLLAMGLLHVNNIQDMNLDRCRGITTLALKLGFRRAKYFLYFIYFSTYVLLYLLHFQKFLFGFPIVAFIGESLILVPFLKSIRKASGPESQTLSQSRFKAAQVHLVSGLALCVNIFLGQYL
jgi:1,4-dihydroxy-2-naphthoate octaprenyltransferase